MSRIVALGVLFVLASCVRIVWRNSKDPFANFDHDLAQCRGQAADANEGTQRVSVERADVGGLLVKACMTAKGWEKKNEF